MFKALLCGFVLVWTFYYVSCIPVKKVIKKEPHPDGCLCEKFSCSCCAHMELPQIGLNDTACVEFAYEPNDYGISFVLEIDDKVLINETISARNPPPICLPIPYIEDFVDACIHFTDLSIKDTVFHGCVALEARMWWVYVVAEVNLGCFDTSNISKYHQQLIQSMVKKGGSSNSTINAV